VSLKPGRMPPMRGRNDEVKQAAWHPCSGVSSDLRRDSVDNEFPDLVPADGPPESFWARLEISAN